MPMPKQLEGKAVPITRQRNQGKGAGRKPKLVRKWVKECNLSKKDAQEMLKSLLANYTLGELEGLKDSEGDRVSVLTFSLMGQVIEAARKNDFSLTRQMLEFLFGKDDQPVSLRDDTRMVDLKNLLLERAGESPEERERIIAGLEQLTDNAG
ncbi:MAG: hypothetical protein LBP76_02130 [Treponema sp.]|jgi:hypothetical protein|nr:hypothetical protein [Treponema sp.]